MFCLITASRPRNDMSSGARGGVGGTMGRRTLAMFMALSRRSGVAQQLISQLGNRNPVLGSRPDACHNPLLVKLGHDVTPDLAGRKPQGCCRIRGHARLHVRRLLAVEQNDVARQAEIASW